MSRPLAPNLNTSYHVIPDSDGGTMLVFPHNYHRTRFVIQHKDVTGETHVWIGRNPSADLTQWLIMDPTGQIPLPVIDFETGIAGPIYFTEAGAATGAICIISPLMEEPTTEALPT